MKTQLYRVLDLNGYQLAKERAIEWHSPQQDAPESCGIMLISPIGVKLWLTFEIAGGVEFRESGFTYPDHEAIGDEFKDPGIYVLSDSHWIQRILQLSSDDWEDWQDRNRIVARSEIKHWVIVTEGFQIDLLASRAELDGQAITIGRNQ